MNNKGQTGLGLMIVTAIGLLVAAVIYGAVAGTVGEVTTEATIVNQTLTTTANTIYLNGKSASGFTAYNATGNLSGTLFNGRTLIGAGNYTITNNQLHPTTGELVSVLTWNANGFNSTINATYNSQPDTYIADSGARAITELILVLSAIAMIVVAIAGARIKEMFDM